MHILMIAPQPFFSPRGTPFSVLHRIKALTSMGHSIDLVTYHIGQDIEIDGLTYHRISSVPGISTIKVGPSVKKIPLDFMLLLKSIRLLLTNKYDYLHTHEEASFFGHYLAKLFRLPHLYDMHSSLPQQLSNFKFTRSKLLIKLFDMLENTVLRNASGVITICPELYNYVHAKFPNKPHKLIENVADNNIVFKEMSPAPEVLRAKWNLNGNPIILYYGTFEPYQGLDLLLKSIKLLQNEDSICILVGGNTEQIQYYRRKAKDLGIADKVIFTGPVQPWEIDGYIKISSVLVSPRLEGNNTPLKVYSYLRSNRPVVATRHMTHTQVLNNDVAVLTDIDPQSFANGIDLCLTEKNISAKIVNNAATLAEKEYSYSRYIETTRDLLAEMMQH